MNYSLEKEDKIIKMIGIFDPNIFKNNILLKIIKCYDGKEKIDIKKYLDEKGIMNDALIPDLYLNNEKNSKYFFNKFKKYIYKYKRNIIYNCYLENSWEKILADKNSNNNNIYNNFPSKEKLLELYNTNDNLFHKIKD